MIYIEYMELIALKKEVVDRDVHEAAMLLDVYMKTIDRFCSCEHLDAIPTNIVDRLFSIGTTFKVTSLVELMNCGNKKFRLHYSSNVIGIGSTTAIMYWPYVMSEVKGWMKNVPECKDYEFMNCITCNK